MRLNSQTFTFLEELKDHNNRDWFNAHRSIFLDVKEGFEVFIDGIIHDFLPFEGSIMGLTGKKSVMRIYRDVRFSADKSPYKINLGASLHNPNHKGNFPGYFISIGPSSSFLAGGFWMPDTPILKAIRQEIDYAPQNFQAILANKKFLETFGELGQESKLKTLPKGYAENHPLIEILKLKSFTASFSIPDQEFFNDSAYHKILEGLKTLIPLIRFLREVVPGSSSL